MLSQHGSYLKPMGLLGMMRTTGSIAFRNLLPFSLIYGVFLFPLLMLDSLVYPQEESWIPYASLPVRYYALVALIGEVSVVVFGATPSITRAFSRIQGKIWLKLIGTEILVVIPLIVLFFCGAILGGVIVAVWDTDVRLIFLPIAILSLVGAYISVVRFIFIPQIVVIEKIYFIKALRRAWAMSKGRSVQIVGYVTVFLIVLVIFFLIILLPYGFLMAALPAENSVSISLTSVLADVYLNIFTICFTVVVTVFLTVFYYSLRVERYEITVESVLGEAMP